MILFLTDRATFSEIKPHPSYSFLSGKPRGAFLTNWDGNSLLTTAAGCFHWEAEGRGVSGVPRLSQRGAATHWAIARRRDGHTDGGGPGGAALRMVRGQGRRTGAPPLPRLSGHPGGECGRPPGSPLRASLSRRGGRGQRDGCHGSKSSRGRMPSAAQRSKSSSMRSAPGFPASSASTLPAGTPARPASSAAVTPIASLRRRTRRAANWNL